jgi:hypothetical protein
MIGTILIQTMDEILSMVLAIKEMHNFVLLFGSGKKKLHKPLPHEQFSLAGAYPKLFLCL